MMKFVPYDELGGIPHIIVDGNPHQDSKLVLSHWIDSGTKKEWMRDTSAQIVLDFLQNGNQLPEDVEVVSNDHFDQDGLIGLFALIAPDFALKNVELLIDIATCGDFGKYKSRKAARISMALARMIHPDAGMVSSEIFKRPYPEQAAHFYQLGLEMLPQLIDDIDHFRHLWEHEDHFLTQCEQNLKNGLIAIEEISAYDLAVVSIPSEIDEDEFHRFTVMRKGPLHDMALHNSTKRGRIIYSYAGQLYFKYRYETWVQLQENIHPLRVGLTKLADELSRIDGAPWRYQGSDKLVPLLERSDKGQSSVPLSSFKDLLIESFKKEAVDWNPYR